MAARNGNARKWGQSCPECGSYRTIILVSHTSRNPNREFVKCNECGKWIGWLDDLDTRKGYTDGGRIPSPRVATIPMTETDIPAEGTDSPIESLYSLPLSSSEGENAVSPVAPKSFVASKYQAAIFDFVQNGQGNAVVEALAGSGKTTTIVEALKSTPVNADVAFLAFNKHIAKELQARAPAHVHVSTMHALGFANIRAQMRSVRVNDYKVSDILKDLARDGIVDENSLFDIAPTVRRLVSLLKATLLEPTADNMAFLCDRYGIVVNGDADKIYTLATRALEENNRRAWTIDFDDMPYWCAIGKYPSQQFDWLFVDEAQDLNRCQIEFLLKSVKPGGRVVAVGDTFQSIYGFRGADTEAIPNVITALSAITLPLSITYRCPLSHVRLAQGIVPQLEAQENAPEGIVGNLEKHEVLSKVAPGDMILCRVNAPLIPMAFTLIRSGVKAVVRGRDIGQGMTNLLKRIEKRSGATSLAGVLVALSDYASVEVGKLEAVGKHAQALALTDQADTLIAIADGCTTTVEVTAKIESLFSDDVEGVVLSSVHRAKGLEAERVFLLNPSLIPHPMAKRDWEKEQETNILYVALTRSKAELYFVEIER